MGDDDPRFRARRFLGLPSEVEASIVVAAHIKPAAAYPCDFRVWHEPDYQQCSQFGR
jgi:hypothetical protein